MYIYFDGTFVMCAQNTSKSDNRTVKDHFSKEQQ